MSSVTPDLTGDRPSSPSLYQNVVTELDQADDHLQVESVLESQNCIAKFERVHGMTSSEMRRKLSSGEIEETYEICRWSQEISFLDELFRSHS